MLDNIPILSILMVLPLVGVLFLCGVRDTPHNEKSYLHIGLWTSSLTFILSCALLVDFNALQKGYQFVENVAWLPAYQVNYIVGVDGLSLFLVLLTTFLIPLCLLASWKSIQKQLKMYVILFLLLETFVIGSFVSLNLIFFYVFFEGVLIPMYFLIGIWGGQSRIYAAYKFFLYTLLGSLLMLIGIAMIYTLTGTFNLTDILPEALADYQHILWWLFFASFAVKMPMWPVHTWLPDAHVQAPTAASVILAGVLLKMGGYGFIRFSLSLFPEASFDYAYIVAGLSIIGLIYTSLIAFVQTDIKKLIAYSSVAHMGYVTLGIFTKSTEALGGAIYQMLSHGVISSGFFLSVGVLYDRMHTREMADYGGVTKVMPRFAFIFMILTFATVGVPGTSGFLGEMMVILGTFVQNPWWCIGIATGLVLGVMYSLRLYRGLFFGKITNDAVAKLSDLSVREIILFAPLLILILWMGILSMPFLNIINQYFL